MEKPEKTIAVYCRLKADDNDMQTVERLLAQVARRAENIKVFIDRGSCGRLADRPAFNELLAFLDQHGASVPVLVPIPWRVSRNVVEIAEMVEAITARGGVISAGTASAMPDSGNMPPPAKGLKLPSKPATGRSGARSGTSETARASWCAIPSAMRTGSNGFRRSSMESR